VCPRTAELRARDDRGGRHRGERQHPLGRAGAQHVEIIDALDASEHAVDDGGGLAPRPVADRHDLISRCFEAKVIEQRGGQDQPGVGDRVVIVEVHPNTVGNLRRCGHPEAAPWFRFMCLVVIHIIPGQGVHLLEPPSPHPITNGGSRLRSFRTMGGMAFERISVDPERMDGVPCIRDLRVAVSMVLGQLAAGRTVEQLLAGYPYLEAEDVRAALEYAAAVVDQRVVPLVRPA
jgi:uncharacterized protein (DUF433 family)